MIRSKKGMLSTVDAVIFVTILALVAACMVAVPEEPEDGPDASELCSDLFDVRLRSSCVLPGSGDAVYSMKDLTAIALSSGETDFLEDYVERAVRGSLPARYGYSVDVVYGDVEKMFGSAAGSSVSSFSTVYDVLGETDLSVTFTVRV